MTLEQQQFERYLPDFSRLEPFGFRRSGDTWQYSRIFPDGDFRADVTVREDGTVTGCVVDLDTGEEFYAIHAEGRFGAFVSTVRDTYCGILREIAEGCFLRQPFVFPQSNRITALIRDRFREEPDFPFENLEGYGVFRYPKSRKWYGLIMIIPRGRLAQEPEDAGDMIEILNVKIDPSRREDLLAADGVYPCYHMNRDNWISIALDGRCSDDFVMDCVRRSREYAVRASCRRFDPVPNGDWILSVNPTYYEVDLLFSDGEEELWKQSSRVCTGDTVYLYIGAPVSAVLFRCLVTETGIPYSYSDGSIEIRKVMRLRKIREYDRDQVPISVLRRLGIETVRGTRMVTGEFLDFIRKVP